MLRRAWKQPDTGEDDASSASAAGISLEREANERLTHWSRAVRRVRVSRSLLSLAWTAGPVTGLGLTGGYFIAYGEPPHAQLLIYFITFTILSGLIGLGAKIVYDSTWGPSREQAEANVLTAIDRLGEWILATRDLHVDSLDGHARRSEAARQLLRRVDLSPEGIAVACEDLTGDRELGETLAHIDHYRRAGLYTRIRDLNERHQEAFDAAYERIRGEAPLAAAALRDRFTGHVPQLRAGIPRNEAFIERVLAAYEQGNPLLITMGDVEDMLSLAFELVSGREIPILNFTYRGRWQIAQALEELETARSRYRLNQAASSNRIRALAAWLIEANALPYETVPEELSSDILLERVTQAMDDMQMRIDRLQALEARRALDRASRARLSQVADTLGTAISLYRSARDAVAALGDAHAKLLTAAEHWTETVKRAPGGPRQLRLGTGRGGLRIVERTVSLEEDARETVCAQLVRYLQGEQEHWRRNRPLGWRPKDQARQITPTQARALAVEVAIALEPHIQLSRPEVQRGLAATNASYLGDLEPGLSAREKRSLGEAMADNVEEDLSRAAEHLAVALVRHYQVELTEAAREFLAETYGARPQVLAAISRGQHASELASQISLLSRRPTPVPPPRRDWYRSLVRARRILR